MHSECSPSREDPKRGQAGVRAVLLAPPGVRIGGVATDGPVCTSSAVFGEPYFTAAVFDGNCYDAPYLRQKLL